MGKKIIWQGAAAAALLIGLYIPSWRGMGSKAWQEEYDAVVQGSEEKNSAATPEEYGMMDEDGVFHIYTGDDLRAFFDFACNGYQHLDAVLEADVDMERVFAVNYRGHLQLWDYPELYGVREGDRK